MTDKIKVAIVGWEIRNRLMHKLLRSTLVEPAYMIGIDPDSKGLRDARAMGLQTSHEGVTWLLAQNDPPRIVFEATSAYVHVRNAPLYKKAGIPAVDLTPAARGPFVVPSVNLAEHLSKPNVNMVTCGGQATIPIIHAVSRCVSVDYAEIVATIASASAGPGTRQNIDEFTRTTSHAVEVVGSTGHGKAIIVLNPSEPPMMMRDTIYCSIPPDSDQEAIERSILQMVEEVATYVPGYRLRTVPQFDYSADDSGASLRSSKLRGQEIFSLRTPATWTL